MVEKELEAYSFVCAGAFAWNIEVQNRLKTMCGAYPHSCFIWGGWQYAPDTLYSGRSPHGARSSGQELDRAPSGCIDRSIEFVWFIEWMALASTANTYFMSEYKGAPAEVPGGFEPCIPMVAPDWSRSRKLLAG